MSTFSNAVSAHSSLYIIDGFNKNTNKTLFAYLVAQYPTKENGFKVLNNFPAGTLTDADIAKRNQGVTDTTPCGYFIFFPSPYLDPVYSDNFAAFILDALLWFAPKGRNNLPPGIQTNAFAWITDLGLLRNMSAWIQNPVGVPPPDPGIKIVTDNFNFDRQTGNFDSTINGYPISRFDTIQIANDNFLQIDLGAFNFQQSINERFKIVPPADSSLLYKLTKIKAPDIEYLRMRTARSKDVNGQFYPHPQIFNFPPSTVPNPNSGIVLMQDANGYRGVLNFQLNVPFVYPIPPAENDTVTDFTPAEQAFYIQPDGGLFQELRYPLFPSNQTGIEAMALVDPADPLGRAVLDATILPTILFHNAQSNNAPNKDYHFLPSFFRTDFGAPVFLLPSPSGRDSIKGDGGLTLCSGRKDITQGPCYLAPIGEFIIVLNDTVKGQLVNKQVRILAGLSGTESFSVTPSFFSDFPAGSAHAQDAFVAAKGDRIVFVPNFQSFASGFPLMNDNAVKNDLLTNDFTTSWLRLKKGDPGNADIVYHSQPKHAPLYARGVDTTITGAGYLSYLPGVSGVVSNPATVPQADINGVLSNAVVFPMTLFDAASFGRAQMFEEQIVAPWRKFVIARQLGILTDTPAPKKSGVTIPIKSTTPQGFYIEIDPSGNWQKLQLAQLSSGANSAPDHLAFTGLSPVFQAALQTNHLCLVVSCDQQVLGTFDNDVMLGGWPFKINVPTKDPQGQYNNVLIFKYRTDMPLLSADQTGGLVCDPSLWALPEHFNIAANSGLYNLSQWLQTYIGAGIDRFQNNDLDYQKFFQIATSPDWQGVIALKVDISLQGFPAELKGLLAGIDMSRLNAHHLGIDLSVIKTDSNGDPVMQPASALFAMIDYEDSVFDAVNANVSQYQQLANLDTSVDYRFDVLQLKVRFENSALVSFNSDIALTVNKLFGEQVLSDNRQNLLVLKGNYELHNGKPSYTFNTTQDSLLYLNSAAILDVEVYKAAFSLLNDTDSVNAFHTRFTFWGFLNFNNLPRFDLLSFGNEPDQLDTDPNTGAVTVKPGDNGKGLAYSNLFIDMKFELDNIDPQTVVVAKRNFIFDMENIAIDLGQSYFRVNSLYQNFPLQISGMVLGNADSMPLKQGYLPMKVKGLSGSSLPDGAWYGLTFKLNMGTFGALASAAGFNTQVVCAWAPGGRSMPVIAGIKMPGANPQAPAFSLQGVLQVNYGNIALENTSGAPPYLMRITKIGLKLLGLTFPSGDRVDFMLFGDPSNKSKPESIGWYGAYNNGQ